MSVSAPRVTIVVTQRESFVHSKRSLESLYATTTQPFSLVYVDGGSPFFTRRYLRREAQARGFQLLRRDTFLAPNQARNLGMTAVNTELVVFAENDVLFRPGWLDALVSACDQTGAAVVGPLISFREPAFTTVHSAGGAICIEPTPQGNSYRNVQRRKPSPMAAAQATLERSAVDFVEFHCFLARTEMIRACGPFDEALTTCCEFDDFCLTVKARGGSVVNEPAAIVHHLLPLPPPQGLGDTRFLRARWNRRGNASSTQHFRRKWNIRDDDSYMRGVAFWCDSRPYTVVANTRPYRILRAIKNRLKSLSSRARPFMTERVPAE